MKEYEIFNDFKVPKGSKIIVRLDGRNFHRLSKELNLNHPYDNDFIQSMINTSQILFNEFSPKFIYTFSDEINILLKEIPFSRRIEKIDSIFPSLAASSLTIELSTFFNNYLDEIIPISFDSRIIPLVPDDVYNYFKWRQDEAWRNCINAYAFWTLKKEFSTKNVVKKLENLKYSDIHELLFKKGINLNNIPTYEKRGIGIYKDNKLNNKMIINKELPKFKRSFFKH